jgi:hypothetical protein
MHANTLQAADDVTLASDRHFQPLAARSEVNYLPRGVEVSNSHCYCYYLSFTQLNMTSSKNTSFTAALHRIKHFIFTYAQHLHKLYTMILKNHSYALYRLKITMQCVISACLIG